jgi:predicted ATPase
VSPRELRQRFDYRMAQAVPLHRLAHIMGHGSPDTTLQYVQGIQSDRQRDVEKIAWGEPGKRRKAMEPRTVFVSHAHQDNALCDAFVAALRTRGVDVWYDRSDLQAGHLLSSAIQRELQARTAFILLATPASIASYWVETELGAFRELAAHDRTRVIIPVLMAPCELPLLLRAYKWIDAVGVPLETVIGQLAPTIGFPHRAEPSAAAHARQAAEAPEQRQHGELELGRARADRRARHNLPIPPTPLLGRAQEVAELTALLRRADVRLVTLTGTGGTGKTQLGQQVAAELAEAFPDGVWFVRLARLSDPALVLPTIAQTLGLQEVGSRPLEEALRAYLRERHLLLLLDNFEQLTAAAPQVGALLADSLGLTVLVTSRVPLHLRGEKTYPVAPLALPPPLTQSSASPALPASLAPDAVERLTQYAAVTLFLQRALDARPDFALTTANAPVVAEICARLDGLPLAIELAAARVKLLPPHQLLQRLERRLPLLTGGAQDLLERQRTMRATLAWSEDLLTPTDRVLFRRLAVFVGGCTLEAAEAVCAAPEGAEPLGMEVLEGLSALVDQSLVQPREEGGEPRFGMLHVIREYALERLEASGEAAALHRTHAAYLLALVEQAEPELVGPAAPGWLDRLEREHDNLRAALGWACACGEVETGLRLVGAIGPFWEARGHLREGQAWVERLLALEAAPRETGGDGDAAASKSPAAAMASTEATASTDATEAARVRGRALFTGARLAWRQGAYAVAADWLEQAEALARRAGDWRTTALAVNALGLLADDQGGRERAAARYEESLALYREADDRWGIALELNNLGNIAVRQGDRERGEALHIEALALFREVGDRMGSALALVSLGVVAMSRGDVERAAARFEESLALNREVGDRGGIAFAWEGLGWVALKRGEVAQAEALGREALALHWDLGDPPWIAGSLEMLASVVVVAGQGERAARLLGAATALREKVGAPLLPTGRGNVEQAVALARAALGEEQWAVAFAAGRALSLEEAVAEALDDEPTR